MRNILLSNQLCRLCHFDRSGAQYTVPFSIHQDVNAFTRIVLGVSSFDERVLGLDTTIQWVHVDGRKTGGTISVEDMNGSSTAYTLCRPDPVFRRYEMLGRGTTGWSALSPDGVEVFIKHSWRDDDPEHDILKRVAGVDGVAQMLSYESSEETTASLRANGFESWPAPKGFRNRTSTRIVMERYGESITSFKSQGQLLSALRDAIAGMSIQFQI